MRLGALANALLGRAGLVVRRARMEHRFDAMPQVLRGLAGAGFAPTVVVDVGANAGQWARLARTVFPEAHLHLVEPQRGLHDRLTQWAAQSPPATLHAVAATGPGVTSVRLAGGGAWDSTGAWVAGAAHMGPADVVRACTLDELILPRLIDADVVLLKLDVEGHELEALGGAGALLARTAVAICEVTFYDVEHHGHPLAKDLVAALDASGFDLFDLAALAGRPRDGRLRSGDAVFVARSHALAQDVGWA